MVCPGPRARTIVRVATAKAGKRLLIFKTAAPTAELYAVQGVIDRMEQSLKVCA
jgi:TusA-related sulfurtransferase